MDICSPFSDLRTCLSWLKFAAIIALQINDRMAAITPIEQKGSLKGRYIFNHFYTTFAFR